jgi:D-sedoheptulose 7-phosphate isomerase
MSSDFLNEYFAAYKALSFDPAIYPLIEKFKDLALGVHQRKAKMLFFGNGASASLAEHGAVDFTKQGKVRSITCHDPNLITCFANDFGYDHWMAKAIELHADVGDVVVLISCSGTSPSVVNAAKTAKAMSLTVVSFTGRDAGNPLKQLSDLAFWVPSHSYNLIENTHGIWLTAAIDLLIGKAEYETRAVPL